MSFFGHILVVDDHDYIRSALARQLELAGHTVVALSDGIQALEAVRQQTFDLILLDILMPGLRGDRVLATLKSDPALRHIPVIVISGDQDLDLVAHCIELGAADYLGKRSMQPFCMRASTPAWSRSGCATLNRRICACVCIS